MSRSRCATRSITQVLLFALCVLMTSATNCEFPAFMTRMSRWETHVTLARTRIGAFWSFPTRSQARLMDLRSNKRTTTTFTCHTAVNLDTFLTSVTADDSTVSYQCFRFIRRSDFVVQLEQSAVFDTDSPDKCLDPSQLQLQDSILVYPRRTAGMSGDLIGCGLVGGYWLSVIDQSGSLTCRDLFLRPIVESDCALTGEGMLIDFRQLTCAVPYLSGTDTSHQMVCLGSWSQYGSVFSVLSNNRDLPQLWMLRIPEDASGPITAHLMTSLSVGPAHNATADQYPLSLTPAAFPTMCENEARGCDVTHCAEDATEVRCQKTCDACAVATGVFTCRFNDSDIGQWFEMSHRHAAADDDNRFATV